MKRPKPRKKAGKAKALRPKIDITFQRGFEIRIKHVGPKKRKIVIKP